MIGVVGTTASLVALVGVLAVEINGLAKVVGASNALVVLALDAAPNTLDVLVAVPNTLVVELTDERVEAMDSEELDDVAVVFTVAAELEEDVLDSLAAERKLNAGDPDLGAPPNNDVDEDGPKVNDKGAAVVVTVAGLVSELSDGRGMFELEDGGITSDEAASLEGTLLGVVVELDKRDASE